MGSGEKAYILTKQDISRAITRIGHEILERNKGPQDLAIVGIRNRGYFIAERIAKEIQKIDGSEVPVGALDINLYRDDLSVVSEQPIIHKTEIDFDISGKKIILVDDVLYTGRTIRSALDALIDFGRPRLIQLAALIDRGHRELPIRADYVGKNIPTSQSQLVQVNLEEVDGKDEVRIESGNHQEKENEN
ncbi:MAG: bifunctional pyr operon transcriptional regulator/uracil phosphoribosyltransferase PyrR [Candidatus Omnitrophota bacterium]|nr:bifunctional pyr operon transcriptional regulator/uracil phosphoribosyltransferase PyrR [Candidatus Omnitrophota bacterium]